MSIAINLSGITFLKEETRKLIFEGKIKLQDPCEVVQTGDMAEKPSADFSVRCRGTHIGWIPRLDTIMKYMNKANIAKDNITYSKQDKRYDTVDIIRGNISTDLHINHKVPSGIISQILFKTKNGFDEDVGGDMSNKIACISVLFEYPYP